VYKNTIGLEINKRQLLGDSSLDNTGRMFSTGKSCDERSCHRKYCSMVSHSRL